MAVRCGNCSYRGNPVTHATVEEVRECFARMYDEVEQIKAERLAEARAERYWEEGTAAQQAAYQGELEMEARALGWV